MPADILGFANAGWRWALIPAGMAVIAVPYREYTVLIANRMKIVQEVGLEAFEFRRLPYSQ
jgi:hypothetical protein